MDGEIFVPFVFFGFLAAVILVPIWLRERTKQSAHHLLSQVLEKGQTLDAATLRQLTEGSTKPPRDKARSSLGSGIVLLALAGGFAAAGYFVGGYAEEAFNGMMIPAVILGALGIAFVLLAIVDYSTKKKDQ